MSTPPGEPIISQSPHRKVGNSTYITVPGPVPVIQARRGRPLETVRPRRPKCSDIDADHVVELARQTFTSGARVGVVAALMAEGWPEKVALAKVYKLVSQGRLDYGVSPYFAWPEP